MFNARRELAVLNNVYWYRAVFSAHRLAYTADDLMWSSEASAPPFHSNLVVLSPAVDLRRAQLRLAHLERALAPAGFSLKDSFANLDLTDSGYEVLFQASWIWHEPPDLRSEPSKGSWVALTGAAELEAWVDAWSGGDGNTASQPRAQQFPPSLLESPHHRFLARFEGKRVVAGAIANRSPGAVGLSNTFDVGAPVFDDWTRLLRCAGDHFPGVPLVGYERGEALSAALAAGFEASGDLRIWQRAPRATASTVSGSYRFSR